MTAIRKLPVGIQDFEDLRTNNYVYVDKTEYLYRLVTMGKPYFLGRPRRFGKSLFLSTLKAYFEGKKQLFDGLAIAGLEQDWTAYPVIYIDLNPESFIDLDSFYMVLDKNLRDAEQRWGKDEADTTPATRLAGLIQHACKQTGQMDDATTAEDALAQIDDKGYLIPYAADYRRVVKIGVEFSAG